MNRLQITNCLRCSMSGELQLEERLRDVEHGLLDLLMTSPDKAVLKSKASQQELELLTLYEGDGLVVKDEVANEVTRFRLSTVGETRVKACHRLTLTETLSKSSSRGICLRASSRPSRSCASCRRMVGRTRS